MSFKINIRVLKFAGTTHTIGFFGTPVRNAHPQEAKIETNEWKDLSVL